MFLLIAPLRTTERNCRRFELDRKSKHHNSFAKKRSTILIGHVHDMVVMQNPAGFAGDRSRLAYSIRITAKTTIKTV
ncbi:hypothetical protein ATO67_09820 [Agrobacterium bohemicum]|uniref:Uncharacterized protein n=1 Tax=Agrobacterium bohemicum TaxID=2052828 RepID=A0A135P0H1_9HYPH|nr:hypothetical protein ATO67_09820 [Agrobacterium bohemicum]